MNEALAHGHSDYIRYYAEDEIERRYARVDVDCRQPPDGPSRAARKKGGEDAA